MFHAYPTYYLERGLDLDYPLKLNWNNINIYFIICSFNESDFFFWGVEYTRQKISTLITYLYKLMWSEIKI